MRRLTLGSLFDGIGAFPFAAALVGIRPVWASEILPEAVSVTRRHYPGMVHVGDITKLDGASLAPVDIIAFGSPCQDISTANGGNRKGLAGERSGLFTQAVRIINEMRDATDGRYPRYAIWENVPGCFSSNARRDYLAVLEAFTGAEIPMPASGRWANAGLVRNRRCHLAWAVYDACRGFGLAQRRKRVFLVADFGKGRPEEILLVPKSLRWYPAQGFGERKGAAAAVESGIGNTGVGIHGNLAGTLDASYFKGTGARCGIERDVVLCAATGQSNAEIYEDCSPTLNCNCEQPYICAERPIAAFNGGASPQAGSISYSEQVSPTLKSASSGLRTPCVCEPTLARTLTARGDSSPCADRGQNIVALETSAAYGFDLQQITSKTNRSAIKDVQPSLCAAGRPHIIHRRMGGMPSPLPEPTTASGKSVTGTLMANAGTKMWLGNQEAFSGDYFPVQDCTVRRLTPTECERLMGFFDGYTACGHDGKEISDRKRYSMLGNSIATPCAVYILQNILEQYGR